MLILIKKRPKGPPVCQQTGGPITGWTYNRDYTVGYINLSDFT